MASLVFRDADLPDCFKNVLVSNDGKIACIRSSLKSIDDCRLWIEKFSLNTCTKWIVRSSFPNTSRLSFRKDYVCQHNRFNKKVQPDVKKQKNCDCPGFIHISVKLTTVNTIKKDNFIKDGLPAKISINLEHSHTLRTAAALSYLKPFDDVRETFEEYFRSGFGIADAIKFHEAKLEIEENAEEVLANGSKNPKYRTVQYWHDEWRKLAYGTRTGEDLYEVMADKQAMYQEKGILISTQRDPMTIVVITPLMQRAHKLPLSKDVVFVDTTSSCDAQNHAITFLLTPCAAGAVPLGVIITSGQTTKDYVAGFELLQKTVRMAFNGNDYPVNFMTDDSDAEREALRVVWPDSKRFLCHFHVSQAIWRWLITKDNGIPQQDRQSLYRSFKAILHSTLVYEAENNFVAATSPEIIQKYPSWSIYLNNYWERKEVWALAWRNVFLHNNHTNNYCEASVRLFKDMVLGRKKAYNVVSLIDFVAITLEEYYVRRLRKFANSRFEAPRLALNAKLAKASYVCKSDIFWEPNSTLFKVPSESSNGSYHEVNTDWGCCTCYSGLLGKFCKHQAAVFFHFQQASPSSPAVSAQSRHEIAILAFGENAKPLEFFQPLRIIQSNMIEGGSATENMASNSLINCTNNDENVPCIPDVDSNMSAASQSKHATDKDFEEYLKAQRLYHEKFGTSKLILNKVMQRLKKVSTRNAWDTFLSTAGSGISCRALSNAKIRVQATSISRRRAGVTRGSKRIPSGRPPVGENRKGMKRKRNLAENVEKNQANSR